MLENIDIISRGYTLRGVINKPDNLNVKVPAVIIFHGFGGNKMGPHFIFTKLSRLLENIGIASIRVDFAGSGESDGDFKDMTISEEIRNAENILEYVKKLNYVDTDNIAILGFSMGGAVASILAAEHKKDIHSLCLWSPAGNMGEIVLKNWIGENYNEYLRNGFYDYNGDVMGKEFIQEISKLNIYDKASGYDKKVFILHGDSDEVVPIKSSLKYIEVYGKNAKLSLITGANHVFDKKEWQDEILKKTICFFNDELIRTKPVTNTVYS